MSFNKLTLAQLNWSDEGVPISEQFDDIYFSTDGGLAEVEYNFIEGNALNERFDSLCSNGSFRIVETGFGSGLNFLRTAELWLQRPACDGQLHFVSFEKHPLSLEDLRRSHNVLPESRALLNEISSALIVKYPLLVSGWHDLYLFEKKVRLTLWFGDLDSGLPELDASQGSKVDAWFLDGFAPCKNPDMWSKTLFQQMARLSKEATTFATFTAAGDVRRGLSEAGFSVEKTQGFGRKRERCLGKLEHARPYSLKAPWFKRPEPVLNGQAGRAVVIGAGLAGASVAAKLAQNGWQIDLLEAESEVATQASGNLAGTVHPLITADWNLRSQWYLQGFEATLQQTKPLLQAKPSIGDLSGLVELAMQDNDDQRNRDVFDRIGLPENLAALVDCEQASDLLGVDVKHGGVFFPEGGWLFPKGVIQGLLEHEGVTLHTGQKVVDIERDSADKWHLSTLSNRFDADAVVVATGSLDAHLNKQLGLPIRPVKGQVTHLSAEQQCRVLKKAVTHDGYSVSHTCGAVTGATFEAPDMTQTMSLQSHKLNLQNTLSALPEWLCSDVSEASVSGRTAFRPTTPDHLPIIGPVADPDWMQTAYLTQSHTHAVYRYPKQRYQPGLFVSNGHGPRGLMSVFLAAESIYADLTGTAPVQPASLYQASHPARFQIRRWRSGKFNG